MPAKSALSAAYSCGIQASDKWATLLLKGTSPQTKMYFACSLMKEERREGRIEGIGKFLKSTYRNISPSLPPPETHTHTHTVQLTTWYDLKVLWTSIPFLINHCVFTASFCNSSSFKCCCQNWNMLWARNVNSLVLALPGVCGALALSPSTLKTKDWKKELLIWTSQYP